MSAHRQRARSATVEITHFDHERVPERVVHARGHRRAIRGHLLRHRGVGIRTRFLAYGAAIPVFCGLSTVPSSRWPAGSVRDIRRLAVGFYTCDATFDFAHN
jgi:catalase